MTSHDPAQCIFCKIVAGDAPSIKLHEDKLTLAIMDINPFNEGHALVLAKEHHATIFDTPAEIVAAAARTAKKIAKAVVRVVPNDGLNLVQSNGPGAAQSVAHFHIHVLPRRKGDNAKLNWDLSPGDREALVDLAAKIKSFL